MSFLLNLIRRRPAVSAMPVAWARAILFCYRPIDLVVCLAIATLVDSDGQCRGGADRVYARAWALSPRTDARKGEVSDSLLRLERGRVIVASKCRGRPTRYAFYNDETTT